MKRYSLLLLISVLFFAHFVAKAQNSFDTLNVMVYNLLFFGGSNPSTCTPHSNAVKAQYASQIVGYVKPDILGVNELSRSQAVADFFLSDVMNTNGRDQYAAAAFFGQGGDNIANMMYYNKEKLRLVSQTNIACTPRHANIYNFEYLDAKATVKPTFSVVVVHLKAANTASDRTQRANCVDNIMSYLRTYHNTPGNYFVMGDFNIYSTDEDAYRKYTDLETNENVRMYDPIYALTTLDGVNQSHIYTGENAAIGKGVWDQPKFAPYHTQSSRASAYRCGVGGGLDDRFDYILATKPLFNDSQKMNIIPGTYRAVGNDGLHYDKSINDGPNNSAPPEIITALYEHSDHLPVTVKVKVRITPPDPFIIPNFTASLTTVTASYLNFTISGALQRTTNALTIAGTLLKDGQVTEATLTGSYLNNIVTQVATVTAYNLVKRVPTPPITGTFIKRNNNIVITASDRVINGTFIEDNTAGVITITGTEQRNGSEIKSLLTLTGMFTITASNFTITINPNQYILAAEDEPITSVSNTPVAPAFEVTPNPANDFLHITATQNIHIETLKMYSITGQLMLQHKPLSNRALVDVKGLPKGIYLLEVNHLYKTKIIIE